MKDERYLKWLIRIHKINYTENGIYEYDIQTLYNTLKEKYKVMYICHDEIDNIHYHFIIHSKNVIRFSTLKNLFPYGNIEKQFGSNLQAYEYLTHKNEDEKVKYSEENIIHNYSEEELKLFLEEKNKDYDVGEKLIKSIEECEDVWLVIKQNPNIWRSVSQVKELFYTYQFYKQNKTYDDIINNTKSKFDNVIVEDNIKIHA